MILILCGFSSGRVKDVHLLRLNYINHTITFLPHILGKTFRAVLMTKMLQNYTIVDWFQKGSIHIYTYGNCV